MSLKYPKLQFDRGTGSRLAQFHSFVAVLVTLPITTNWNFIEYYFKCNLLCYCYHHTDRKKQAPNSSSVVTLVCYQGLVQDLTWLRQLPINDKLPTRIRLYLRWHMNLIHHIWMLTVGKYLFGLLSRAGAGSYMAQTAAYQKQTSNPDQALFEMTYESNPPHLNADCR